jgi:uncharacterized phage protein (TIGR02218 family)
MPRTASTNLKSHLALKTTTTSYLWEITRKDAQVFRFTDHDVDISWGGNTYYAVNSAELSEIDQSAQLNPDNFDFAFILSDNDIAKDDVVAGLFDHADVKVHLINYESTADDTTKIAKGKLGQVTMGEDNKATIEFRSLTQLLSQNIGRTYTHECDADLGDSRCGVTLSSYTATGSITGVTDNQNFSDSSRSEVDDYFQYGLFTWTSGNNDGLTMEVKTFTSSGGIFKLVSPMPFTVATGDTFSVYRGCDKTKSTCISVFDNVLNFRGFAEIPGWDQVNIVPDINKDAGLHD